MRYDDWDVLLFPKDSNVPTQEFKTACYVSSDEYGRQTPHLTCYIYSLPPSTPIRISLHSWAATTKPSALIESQRKPNQKVVYTVKVIIDGVGVFRNRFDLASKWPKEITHEKRAFAVEQPTNQQKPYLIFPPFHQQTLMQSSWNPQDHSGKIKLMLSEQLINRTDHPTNLEAGATNDIVCFSFQHAPKDVLEQAGISWPIRNPLHLPNAHNRAPVPSRLSPPFPSVSKSIKVGMDSHMYSPSHRPRAAFAKLQNPESRRPHSHLPPISHFSRPPAATRGHGNGGIWDDGFVPAAEIVDYAIMDTTNSRKRNNSTSTKDTSMPDYLSTVSQPSHLGPPWVAPIPPSHRTRTSLGNETPAVMNIRDNQNLGTSSPPKRNRDSSLLGLGISHQDSAALNLQGPPHTYHTYFAPNMRPGAFTNRQSSAAVARNSGYTDMNRNTSLNKQSPDTLSAMHRPADWSMDKENMPPRQLRLPTPHPLSRIPMPVSLTQARQSTLSDISMRDASSLFPNAPRFDRSRAPTPSQGAGLQHIPFGSGTVKSRKEGLGRGSPLESGRNVRHDQSLLPAIDDGSCTHPIEIIDLETIDPALAAPIPANTPHAGTGYVKESQTGELEELGDDATRVGAEDVPTMMTAMTQHGHKSSIDSTGRLEQQLFSALGDELAGFGDGVDMAAQFAQALESTGESSAGESDAKRKREMGGEDDCESRGRKRNSGGQRIGESEEEEDDMLELGHGYEG